MSDIGILNGPLANAFILLLFGAPGLPFGALAGALAWRGHRVWGALLGAAGGYAVCLLCWLYFTDNL